MGKQNIQYTAVSRVCWVCRVGGGEYQALLRFRMYLPVFKWERLTRSFE